MAFKGNSEKQLVAIPQPSYGASPLRNILGLRPLSTLDATYLAGPETITKIITKTADAISYWILYYTAVKDQIPDKLKQNITKNPVYNI